MVDLNPDKPPRPRRRLLPRLSVRGLMALVLLIGGWLGVMITGPASSVMPWRRSSGPAEVSPTTGNGPTGSISRRSPRGPGG